MRSLVLGASGHIGNAVARALLHAGHAVTAASRDPGRAANLAGLEVVPAPGDAEAPGQIEAWVRDHELVVDAAAPYPLHAFRDGAREAQALARTQRLLEAVRDCGAQLAYVSSFTTLARRRDPLAALQGSLVRGAHPYFLVKERIEARVLRAARAGLPAVIVNPTVCLGPWDLKPRALCLLPAILRAELPATVRDVINVIDVRDVAHGLLAAVEDERYGEPIALCGHNLAFDDLVRRVCAAGGVTPPAWRGSTGLGALAAYWTEACLALAGQRSPYPSLSLLLLCECHAMQPGEAQRALGISARPLEETVGDSIAWYRRIGYC